MKNWFGFKNIRLLTMIILVVFLFSFGKYRNEGRKISKPVVEFIGAEQLLVTHETVNKLLIENKSEALTVRKVALDLKNIENSVKSHEMVHSAEVFMSIDGVLKAVVKQKIPIARYVDKDKSYYIDYDGTEMPLSAIHAVRVPLVTGYFEAEKNKSACEVFRMIYEDEFLKKNIIGIKVFQNGNLMLKNRSYNIDIDFGKPDGAKEKFGNYKAFFQKATEDSTIYKYKKIDLRFNKQVIGIK